MAIWSLCLVAGIIIVSISVSSAHKVEKGSTEANFGSCGVNGIDAAFQCTGMARLPERREDYDHVVQQVCRANRTKEVVDCIDHLNNFYDCTQDPVFQMFVQADRFLEFIDYFCSQSQIYVDNGLCISMAYEASLNCSAEAIRSLTAISEDDSEEHRVMHTLTIAEGTALICSHFLVMTSCHIDSIDKDCGREAANYADNQWQFEMSYCYQFISTQPGTTPQLYDPDSVTQDQTGQESFNGSASVRQPITVFILFVMVFLM